MSWARVQIGPNLPGRQVYLAGGASAVVEGWRASTADIDFVAEPESRELFESLPELKNRLGPEEE